MEQLLEIRTVEELNRALLLQRTTAHKITQEIDDLIKGIATQENQDDDEYLASMLMEREGELLRKYAALPTLIEYERSPHLKDVMESAGTFAVTTIIGEVILANVRSLSDAFVRAHRALLLVVLNEISKPVSEDGDLVDTILRSMKFEFDERSQSMSEAQRTKGLRSAVAPVAEAIVLVLQQYRMIEVPEGAQGYVITPHGQRVLLHLFAAQTFVEAVTRAHGALQKTVIRTSAAAEAKNEKTN
jgi:hypothetical protein